jgi:hypothetical protein
MNADTKEWENFASPLLPYLMENLSDFIPAKKKFLVEVEISTPPGDYKPDEAINSFMAYINNGNWPSGETINVKLIDPVEK